MKKILISTAYRFLFVFLFSLIAVVIYSQDSTSSSSSTTVIKETTTTTTNWYAQPWVWIVGGAVFLIILVALLRGSGSDREVTRTTVIKSDRT